MTHSIAEIAKSLGAEALGNTDLRISGVAEPAGAGPDDLALAMKPEFAKDLPKGQARAAMLWQGADWQAMGLEAAIVAPRPRFALAGLSALMDRGQFFDRGIHPSSVIDPSAQLGTDVSVGPFSVIGPRAKIGAGSVIGPQCFIGADVTLGEGAFLREGVGIGARATIGARFIAQPGARVAPDGLSFVTPEPSGVEGVRASLGGETEAAAAAQSWTRIHSLGSVTIGDDVEIGSNTCIDCGTVRDTRIGNGVKIDNLVHIAHNVEIGNDCLLAGQVGIAGSTKIGNNVVMGGQVGVSDNISIGDNVVAGGASKILTKIPAGRAVLGYPAVNMDKHLEMYKGLRRLSRLFGDVAALQKAVFKKDAKE